jgi:hypothetical protein
MSRRSSCPALVLAPQCRYVSSTATSSSSGRSRHGACIRSSTGRQAPPTLHSTTLRYTNRHYFLLTQFLKYSTNRNHGADGISWRTCPSPPTFGTFSLMTVRLDPPERDTGYRGPSHRVGLIQRQPLWKECRPPICTPSLAGALAGLACIRTRKLIASQATMLIHKVAQNTKPGQRQSILTRDENDVEDSAYILGVGA